MAAAQTGQQRRLIRELTNANVVLNKFREKYANEANSPNVAKIIEELNDVCKNGLEKLKAIKMNELNFPSWVSQTTRIDSLKGEVNALKERYNKTRNDEVKLYRSYNTHLNKIKTDLNQLAEHNEQVRNAISDLTGVSSFNDIIKVNRRLEELVSVIIRDFSNNEEAMDTTDSDDLIELRTSRKELSDINIIVTEYYSSKSNIIRQSVRANELVTDIKRIIEDVNTAENKILELTVEIKKLQDENENLKEEQNNDENKEVEQNNDENKEVSRSQLLNDRAVLKQSLEILNYKYIQSETNYNARIKLLESELQTLRTKKDQDKARIEKLETQLKESLNKIGKLTEDDASLNASHKEVIAKLTDQNERMIAMINDLVKQSNTHKNTRDNFKSFIKSVGNAYGMVIYDDDDSIRNGYINIIRINETYNKNKNELLEHLRSDKKGIEFLLFIALMNDVIGSSDDTELTITKFVEFLKQYNDKNDTIQQILRQTESTPPQDVNRQSVRFNLNEIINDDSISQENLTQVMNEIDRDGSLSNDINDDDIKNMIDNINVTEVWDNSAHSFDTNYLLENNVMDQEPLENNAMEQEPLENNAMDQEPLENNAIDQESNETRQESTTQDDILVQESTTQADAVQESSTQADVVQESTKQRRPLKTVENPDTIISIGMAFNVANKSAKKSKKKRRDPYVKRRRRKGNTRKETLTQTETIAKMEVSAAEKSNRRVSAADRRRSLPDAELDDSKVSKTYELSSVPDEINLRKNLIDMADDEVRELDEDERRINRTMQVSAEAIEAFRDYEAKDTEFRGASSGDDEDL